jgi:hypothetical protein
MLNLAALRAWASKTNRFASNKTFDCFITPHVTGSRTASPAWVAGRGRNTAFQFDLGKLRPNPICANAWLAWAANTRASNSRANEAFDLPG